MQGPRPSGWKLVVPATLFSLFILSILFIPSKRMLDALKEVSGGIVDLLYPPRCLTCGALDEPFCGGCRESIIPIEEGAPVPAGIGEVASVGEHEGALREAVLRLKFGRKTALAAPLGELLAAELEALRRDWQPDALVPVPIHWTRRLERGFNQAELMAQAVSRWTGLPVFSALRRTRPTPPQVGLSGELRRANLQGAFAVERRIGIAGLRLVLIDDVRTTGTTLTECARVLREAGAREVHALTVTYDV